MEVRNGISAHFYFVCFKNFQCAFKRYRVEKSSAENGGCGKLLVFLCDRFKRCRHIAKQLRSDFGKLSQRFVKFVVAAPFGCEHCHYVKLRRKRFRSRYACFGTCVAVKRKIDCFCKRRAFVVRYRSRKCSVFFGVFYNADNVFRHSRL